MFKILTFQLKRQPLSGESDENITKITLHATKSMHFSYLSLVLKQQFNFLLSWGVGGLLVG